MDPHGAVYIHLAGRPLSKRYTDAVEDATTAMDHAASTLPFRDKQKRGRRGDFPAINVGIASGSGNSVRPCRGIAFLRFETPGILPEVQRPHVLLVHGDQVSSIQELLGNQGIRRISGYANSELVIRV